MEQRLSYFRYGAVSVAPLRVDIGYLYRQNVKRNGSTTLEFRTMIEPPA